MAVACKIIALLALALAVLAAPMVANASVSCRQLYGKLAPCISYVTGRGSLQPSCCSGLRSINAAATTTPDRQAACWCLQQASKGVAINLGLAVGLPGKCGVSIPYPITGSIDCNSIK